MKSLLSITLLIISFSGCTVTGKGAKNSQQSCEAGIIVFNDVRGNPHSIKDDNGLAIPCKQKLQTSAITEGH